MDRYLLLRKNIVFKCIKTFWHSYIDYKFNRAIVRNTSCFYCNVIFTVQTFRSNGAVLRTFQGHWKYERLVFNYSLITEIAQCLTTSCALLHSNQIVVVHGRLPFFFLPRPFGKWLLMDFVVVLHLFAVALLSNTDLQYICSESHKDQAVIKQQLWLQPPSTALHRFLEQGPVCPKPAASKRK